ncbi:UNVERIFIED_CONTAM: hypothetical protein HDU68_002888, partial [Siphonaria sp. JEL0065]
MSSDTYSDTITSDFVFGEQDDQDHYATDDDDMFDVYDIVDAIVPRHDNPTLPSLTF